jgi:hypothetical protein
VNVQTFNDNLEELHVTHTSLHELIREGASGEYDAINQANTVLNADIKLLERERDRERECSNELSLEREREGSNEFSLFLTVH